MGILKTRRAQAVVVILLLGDSGRLAAGPRQVGGRLAIGARGVQGEFKVTVTTSGELEPSSSSRSPVPPNTSRPRSTR
jgi:hypothetical protein